MRTVFPDRGRFSAAAVAAAAAAPIDAPDPREEAHQCEELWHLGALPVAYRVPQHVQGTRVNVGICGCWDVGFPDSLVKPVIRFALMRHQLHTVQGPGSPSGVSCSVGFCWVQCMYASSLQRRSKLNPSMCSAAAAAAAAAAVTPPQEYRETTLNAAVDALYSEMASRHRVRAPCIFVSGLLFLGGCHIWKQQGGGAGACFGRRWSSVLCS